MPIRSRLAVVMGEKGVRNISQLSRMTGLARTTLTTLWYNRAKGVNFETLEALCKALNCQPGDLLVYIPDEGGEAR
ncbi:putative transcriptional regulator [Thermodesulfitimonas autotrophica]|uniref:Putative transcriptional regulator n=1 Tax=Thermodesulfitimonas autotrophica TaxID=1894989 RepID=A0A3N5AQG9_9THEO|nr:helix-turn-helix transcriptional regulator [Thermodesulfitimonas autotrophica]RPF47107.1 putative transcriptional regulator [Thermodesulfitimonas autotrophica]